MNKKCPFCSEWIKKDAKKCRYCGEWLNEKENKAPSKNTIPPLKRYYLLWLASILVFFGTLVLSENAYIPDYLCLFVVGVSAFIGFFSLLRLLRLIIKPAAAPERTKYIILGLASFVLLFFLIKTDPHVFRYSPDEAGLRKTAEEQYKLAANPSEQEDREIYENYLSSSFKNSIAEKDYVDNNLAANQSKGIVTNKYTINSIYINGTEGYIDRTAYGCSDASCTSVKDQTRSFRKYVYENQRWLMTDEIVICPRKQMYNMDPAFSRAISLISQRLSSDNNATTLENCLNVQYATADDEMNGAEGFFRFVPGQSPLQLNIVVSPKYQYTDDYLTAFLLAHEIQHAANYIKGLADGKPVDCFEDEAEAFNAQYYFLTQLNQEERDSLIARFYNNPSQEIQGMYYTYDAIQRQPGSDFETKAINYLKTIPYYQQECSGR